MPHTQGTSERHNDETESNAEEVVAQNEVHPSSIEFLGDDISDAKALLEKREQEFGHEHMQTAMAAHTVGRLLFEAHQYKEAEAYLKMAADIERLTRDTADLTMLAVRLENLGYCQKENNKLEPAKNALHEALEIRESIKGKDHITQATCINELAQIYFLEENFSESELLCRRLVRIVDHFIGPESVEVAICYMNLGCVLEFREAEITAKPDKRAMSTELSSSRLSNNASPGLKTPRTRLAQSLQPFPSASQTSASLSRTGSTLSPGRSPRAYRGRISARIGTDPHSPRMSNTLSVRGLLEDLENEDNPEYLYDRPNTSGRRVNSQVMKQLEESLECYESALKILQTELKAIAARSEGGGHRPGSRGGPKKRVNEAGKKSKRAINFLMAHLMNQMSYVKDSLGRHDEAKVHNYESLLHFKRSILGEQRSKAAQAAHLRHQFHAREEKKAAAGFDVKRAVLGTPPNRESKKADDLEILTLSSPAEVAWEISYEQCMFERLEFPTGVSDGFRETLPLEYVDRIMRPKLRHREALQRTRMLDTLRREKDDHRF
uniref:Kinesin light chain n=1 Tax=Palpitomonas bilix TaxID=652834 RepID=A0A7S3LRY6_9EUKA|mmetsp:Transcript_43720/g.113974  ORF Transcript_43720/g.113974 Transcript_43720/m.113974 type:complete len:550 (+) Transcript_43720:329-1978(+)|eukprot:CAMPEP_0113870784 /NCGR_PEP_ID=MMETSP0780_2-20120614/2278_1 /TAXON_ID=652834 /ORGANISM="Palpitomonas bilix" /LENGTH=549 /DNA_ID=CAMNT_0000856099 /DNA_START=328 /DNA_END=1977 /DNA_ORIENTATION=+ /assembly_acc=CAM_ASM_000599